MSLSYDAAVQVVRTLVRAFFRRVEVTGLENIPTDRGGLVIAWHPNGMIDPGLIIASFPGRVAFGARHGLFKVPLLGALLRAVDAVPIYRAVDQKKTSESGRRGANQQSLGALAGAIAGGRYAALFPEGISHDAPHLAELKTGAARLYYQALAGADPNAPPPVIVPVGLHYDDKRAFRSSALVSFEPPLELSVELAALPAEDEPDELRRERARALTGEIERVLREVVRATESWELHHLMHRARKLIRAERAKRAKSDLDKPDMRERALGFARVWAGYYARLETDPQRVAALTARLARYDADLRVLALEDHELDGTPRLGSVWLPALLALQVLIVYLLLPPILLVGYVVNLPVALLLIAVSKLTASAYKDEATVKVLLGGLLFPLSWIAAGVLAARAHVELHHSMQWLPNTPITTGVLFALASAVGGMVALRYLQVARETARAVRIRLFRPWRRRHVERLLLERATLHDAIVATAEGLELPGQVGADGRIVDAPAH